MYFNIFQIKMYIFQMKINIFQIKINIFQMKINIFQMKINIFQMKIYLTTRHSKIIRIICTFLPLCNIIPSLKLENYKLNKFTAIVITKYINLKIRLKIQVKQPVETSIVRAKIVVGIIFQ